MDKLLDSIYYNTSSPACYAGINAVLREAKKYKPLIKRKDVEEYLQKQHAYTLHKPIRRKFPRRKVVAICIDSHWQADLCDMQKLAKHNEGYRYILTCVDVFSKFVWGIPMKNKTPEAAKTAFMQILKQGRKPWWLYTDRGKEFTGKPFQDLMEKKYIIHYVATSFPDVKCPNVERFNRTLKTRLWKYFTQRKTFRYINVLQTIISAINHSLSQPLGCRPVDVTRENEAEIRERLYGKPLTKKMTFKFNIGDPVRITKEKGKFEKGYLPNFTQEIFTISKRLHKNPPAYRIKDQQGEEIEGLFYTQELVKAVTEPGGRPKRYR